MPLPDEGLIHTWLDGQLSADEAARVEHLIATDAEWAAAAAEARGLVAASSRILSALDDVPRGVLPAAATRRPLRRLPWWTKAAAAIVVIAGTSTLVLERTPAPTITAGPAAPVVPVVPVVVPPSPPPARTLPEVPSAKRVEPAQRGRVDVVRADQAKASPPPAAVVEKPAAERTVERTVELAAERAAEKGQRESQPVQQVQESPATRQASNLVARLGSQPALSLQSVVVTGLAAPSDAARSMEPQAEVKARPVVDTTPRAVGGGGVARVARDQVMAKAAAPVMSPGPAGELAVATPGACYLLRDSRTLAATGVIMRGDRLVGDTLFLAPLSSASTTRGWVVAHETVLRGVLTTEPEARGMLLVTATMTPCPLP